MNVEYKVAHEVAEQEFERFIAANALLISQPDMTLEDKASLDEQKNRIIHAIQTGALVVNENGEPVFHPQRVKESNPITFYEPTGAALMAMDRKKAGQDVGKMFSTMADMTKTDTKVFATMKMADLKVCLAVATLFLG